LTLLIPLITLGLPDPTSIASRIGAGAQDGEPRRAPCAYSIDQ
jgi:hypothetical protein